VVVFAPAIRPEPSVRIRARQEGHVPKSAAASSQLEEIRTAIEGATGQTMVRAGSGYKGTCPVHDDQQASLSIRDDRDGGRVRMNCHAGCEYLDVSRALELTKNDFLYPTNGHRPTARHREVIRQEQTATKALGREVARYPYTDETGNTLYFNVRFEPKDFRMEGPKGQSSLPRTVPRVPYNLPAVLAAIAAEQTIYWVEGEKDVASLAARGQVGTTCAGGAKATIEPGWADWFTGADLVVVADNDKVGKAYARRVANTLVNATLRTRVAWPALNIAKADLTDHFEAGHTIQELDWQPANAVRRTAVSLAQLRHIPQTPIRWLIPGMIPEGSGLVLLVGAPKAGKSWFNLNLQTAIASGDFRGMFDWGEKVDPGDCLYLALEDSLQRLSRRWDQMLGNIDIADEREANSDIWIDLPPLSAGGEDRIRGWLDVHPRARCVIVDVLAKVREDGGDQGNSYQMDYDSMQTLKAIADEYGVTVMVTHHDRKKKHEGDFMDQVSGTKGITGAADTVLYLKRERGSDQGQIEVTGRDVEEAKFTMQFVREQGRWVIVELGEIDSQHEGQSGPRPESIPAGVLVALEQSGKAMSVQELADLVGARTDSVQVALSRLRRDGRVNSPAKGSWAVGT
jgi:AAA domain